MKRLNFLTAIAAAGSLLLLVSCNSGENKSGNESSSDTTAVKPDTTATTPATNPSGPLSVMTIKHKVANYAKWKAAYDAHDSDRQANGLHNYIIARGVDDSNMVMVALKMDDVDKAKAMGASNALKERMKKAGVVGPTAIDYTTAVMNDTTALQQTIRVIVKHKVKDFDAWKKVFDSHKQARMDAGLTDRVVGYTAGDNHNVTVVFAVADLAKAKAFMNSKDLKDKMKEGGVEGPPSIFFYRIAEKY